MPSVIRRTPTLLLLGVLVLSTPACMIHRHTVGAGPGGYGQESVRQYYLFWGLYRLNDADSQRLARNLSGYEIRTEWGWMDLLLAPILLPLLTTSRTITVYK